MTNLANEKLILGRFYLFGDPLEGKRKFGSCTGCTFDQKLLLMGFDNMLDY
jgi:hypothetical protein